MFCGGEETIPPGLGVSAASDPPPSSLGGAPQAPKFRPNKQVFTRNRRSCSTLRAARVCSPRTNKGYSVVLFVLRHSLHSLWVGMAPLFESIPARGKPTALSVLGPRAQALTPPLSLRYSHDGETTPPGLAPNRCTHRHASNVTSVRVVCTV